MVQILGGAKFRPRQHRPTAKLQNTTVRDFGGGLNVVDSELNLTSKYAPVFDNMVTYTDRRVGPRQGYELWLKCKQGVEQSGFTGLYFSFTAGVRRVYINWAGHPFAIGAPYQNIQHITLSGFDPPTSYFGIPGSDFNRTHGVVVHDANTLSIVVATAATSTAASQGPWNVSWTRDTHMCGGSPIEAFYFSNHVVVWTDCGEIFVVNSSKGSTRVWSNYEAFNQAGNPIGWSYSQIIAKDVFGKELLCCNGVDKPIAISFETYPYAKYQVDPGNSFSNDKIPAFDVCKSAFRYWTVHDPSGDHKTEIRVAAKDTSVVFSDAPDAGDAVDVNVSKITASVELTVRAYATIKDALLVIMPSATILMKYGFYDTLDNHDPQPNDMLNGFGTSAMRSVVEIGSDVFMIDYNGVPSARLSSVSNAVVPERVSQFVETMMSKHIGRMQKETTRLKLFGFFDPKNRLVHFYLPKYDETDIRSLNYDPFYYDSDIAKQTQSQLVVRHDRHQLEVGDVVRISGATGFGVLAAGDINGDRVVAGILSDDYLLINISKDLPDGSNEGGGGNAVKLQPLNNESIGYIYHFVPAMKMQSWSRFKLMKVTCGCATIQGRAFVFDVNGNMLRYGSPDQPIYGDWLNYYDYLTWAAGKTYNVGERVFDASDGLVYKCIASAVSGAANFRAARLEDPDSWEQYAGEPVKFAWELPWADFGTRQLTKALRFLHVDATGNAQFDVELFNDNLYRDVATGTLIPARKITFVPNEAFAFGGGIQTYGGGRRSREQRLWSMPVKFKILKIRASGGTVAPLSFSAFSFLYQRGAAVRG